MHAHLLTSPTGQNFEGGISERPGGEAHGAYTFCGLACLAILDAPYRIFPKYVQSLLLLLLFSVPSPLLLATHSMTRIHGFRSAAPF